MFIITIKPSLKKCCIALISTFIVVFSIFILVNDSKTYAVDQKIKSENVINNDERVKYIENFGWDIDTEAIEVVSVKIPQEFNDVYKTYNKLQTSQGFNLEKYKGKLVKRYTYEVNNYKNEPEYVRVNLLIYNNNIIASDISSLKLDGFMHSLDDTSNLIM